MRQNPDNKVGISIRDTPVLRYPGTRSLGIQEIPKSFDITLVYKDVAGAELMIETESDNDFPSIFEQESGT